MITFDTGALIAIERRDRAMLALYEQLVRIRARITIPTCVVGEWWRDQRGKLARVLDGAVVEPLTLQLAKLAGSVQAQVSGATMVDSVVVASAAQRGDLILTSDVGDLTRIRDAMFPAVRIRKI